MCFSNAQGGRTPVRLERFVPPQPRPRPRPRSDRWAVHTATPTHSLRGTKPTAGAGVPGTSRAAADPGREPGRAAAGAEGRPSPGSYGRSGALDGDKENGGAGGRAEAPRASRSLSVRGHGSSDPSHLITRLPLGVACPLLRVTGVRPLDSRWPLGTGSMVSLGGVGALWPLAEEGP